MVLPPDHNNGPTLTWVTATLDIIAAFFIALRLWIRYRHHKIGWDDWTILIAYLIANTRMIFQILQSFHGNGRHKVYLTDEQYIQCVKWGWYAQLGLFGGNCFCKMSICLLILRIKETKFLKRLLGSVIFGLVLTNATFDIILLAECSPVKAYWRPDAGHCWTSKARIYTAYIAVGYGVVTDILLSLLPANIVWNLRMPLTKKLLVSGLMSLGLVATGFGIARAATLGTSTEDITWDYCIVAIWSNVELWLAIIAANLALGRSMVYYVFGSSSDDDDGAIHAMPYNYHGNTAHDSQAGHHNSSRYRRNRKHSTVDITLESMNDSKRDHQPIKPDQNEANWDVQRRASSAQSGVVSDIRSIT